MRRRRRAGLDIEVWGDGEAPREFLYVDDAAEGIVLAAHLYDGADPVNLGVGRETRIRDLLSMIVELTGFRGEICWGHDEAGRQPRRLGSIPAVPENASVSRPRRGSRRA